MASNAEQLFEQISNAADKVAVLRAMISPPSPTFEEEWLDFKSGTDGPPVSPVDLPREIVKKLWSTALAGFANTGGGVLIWGIDARPTTSPSDPTKKIDAACGLRLVPNPDALRTQIVQLHHQATDPPVSGVRVEPIHDPAGGGFVVCLIPESNFKPHRAELVENRPYFFRIGDNFKIMPTSVLRSMFFPRASPRYSGEVRCKALNLHSPVISSIRIEIGLENHGAATARDPFMSVQLEPVLGSVRSINMAWQYTGTGYQYLSSVHPGAKSIPLIMDWQTAGADLGKLGTISVRMTIHALDAVPQKCFAIFDAREIVNREVVKIATQELGGN
jgi:hypothetical protein